MKLRENLQRTFLAPILGLIFAFFLCFVNQGNVSAKPLDTPISVTPKTHSSLTILADIEDGTPDEDEDEDRGEKDKEKEDDKAPETCYDQVKGIGWLVCPTTGVLAQAVDSIYKAIDKMLVVRPVTSDSESPIYTVWQYVRDLTNIIFIILIIVVVYSHLTGVGFDNYNIKKILPKLIITAILINLSFVICSALVDTSNIIGSSLRGFFENIEAQINAGGEALVSWETLAAVLTGGTAVAGFAISAAGGAGAFIWMLIPTLLSAFLAVVVGLITIAMRQAVVALLIMIAPLAFVCYMLPNTNKWFSKWKDTLAAMLFFFPMFSLLFGASHLAGWALIANAQQDGSYFMLILGMAVQVVPLFLCVPMMKMSNSILGQISNKLSGVANGLDKRARVTSDSFRDAARARKFAEASTRNFNPLSGASVATAFQRRQAIRAAEQQTNEERLKASNELYTNARKDGRKIIGWNKRGNPIYSRRVRSNQTMLDEYKSREVKLSAEAEKLHLDNAMGNIDAYMRSRNFTDDKLSTAAEGQAENYLNLRTQQSAKARNDRSDQRFYFEQVQKASELDRKTGKIVNQRLYDQLVKAGAGADAYDISKNKDTIRQNALTTVTADAYEAYEKARKETTSKYATYFDKQITKNVLKGYNSSLKDTNIDAITAAQDTLAKRGDYDKIQEYLSHFMDHTASSDGEVDFTNQKEYVRLGTDFSNVLASNLMQYKDAAPILGRFGKFINMETWQESEGNRKGHETITFKEYVTGQTEDGLYSNPKTSMASLLQGTNLTKIDRTGFGALKQAINTYYPNDEQAFTRIVSNFVPQMISAIPTFETDGEQIMNTLGFMTGMKWSSKEQMWVQDGPIHDNIIDTYMKGLTDKDINVFKTNAYQAICSAIAAQNGMTAYETTDKSGVIKYDTNGKPTNLVYDKKSGKPKFAPSQFIKDEFRKLAKPEVIAAIQNNINNGTNVGMKPTVMEAFGLTIPKS